MDAPEPTHRLITQKEPVILYESGQPKRSYRPESPLRPRSAPRNGTQRGLRTAQSGQAASGFTRNQSLQAGVDQGGLLADTGQLRSALEQILVNNQCRSHMHDYVSIRHTSQTALHRGDVKLLV